jgi:hypothetical protein
MPILSTFGAASARGFKRSNKKIVPWLEASVTGGGQPVGINSKNAWIFMSSGTLVVTNPSTVNLVIVSGGNSAPNSYPYGNPCNGGHGGNIYSNNSLYLAVGTYTITVGGISGTSSAFGYSVNAQSQSNASTSNGYFADGGNSCYSSGGPGYVADNGPLFGNSFDCGSSDGGYCPSLYWNQGGQGATGYYNSIIGSFNPVVLYLGNGGGGGSLDSGGGSGYYSQGGAGNGGSTNGFYLDPNVTITCGCGNAAGTDIPYGTAGYSGYTNGANAYSGYSPNTRYLYAGNGGGGSGSNNYNGAGNGLGSSGAVIIWQEL